jgi:hypothetical protein
MPIPSDPIADETARQADITAALAAEPIPPKPDPITPQYNTDESWRNPSLPRSANESDVQAMLGSERFEIDQLKALGREAEASQRFNDIAKFEARIRGELGVSAPVKDPLADELAAIGRVKSAKVSDYRRPDFGAHPGSKDEDTHHAIGNEFAELGAKNNLTQQSLNWLSDSYGRIVAEFRPLATPEAKDQWIAQQNQIGERSAGGYRAWKAAQETAEKFIAGTRLQAASKVLLNSAEFVLTVQNLETARRDFEASKRK